MRLRKNFYLLSSLIFSMTALYTSNANAQCFNEAGKTYKIDPDYLRAIAWQESRFKANAININKDKSKDLGLMQINSNNFPMLRKVFPHLNEKNLLKYPCFNVYVGGYILRKNFDMYGTKWISVGMYNAGMKNKEQTIKNRYNYAKKINKHYNDIKSGRLSLPNLPILEK
ncbi:lytic transglycosylase domain-containing protein [Pasteurella multocida]|uniref:lytic transglycosylase domain-containing protein n=1 Tax=Pasteurella multocida TaxID=747 RepID=UPI00147DD41A|nr:lytic transglycosylase domain-containing protein [Pasteurella multocida]NNH97773.1 lytic transglycosylase [Pasteurella multocida]NNI42884.1 lytic transglycosylase [Pasteurella multocida]